MIWNLQKYSNIIALITAEKEYSYSDLSVLCDSIAESIPERSLVFSLCTNTVGSIAGYVSFLNHGIVPLMLDAKIDVELLSILIATYEPSFCWVPANMCDCFTGWEITKNISDYVLLKNINDSHYRLNPDLCLLITTSGSTGSPKLVRQSYKNILANTKSIIEYLEIDEKERAITALPMNYVFGLSVLNTHLFAGASVVVTEIPYYSNKFWKMVDEKSVTSFSGVPFSYETLDKLNFSKTNRPSLRTMTQAGGKISPELQRKFSEFAARTGKKFIVMYGASEATSRMGYLPHEYALVKNGSMGVAIPGGRFEIVDNDGQTVSNDTVGELIYYGDNVTLGYSICLEDLSKGDENHGRLSTGDMAYRDEEGFYYVVGRKKRFIKILGKRVNLDETERLLKDKLQNTDIACGGKDDALRIFITDDSYSESVSEYIYNTLGINRGLFKVVVINEIPKNPSGKTLYSKLAEYE